MHTSLSKYSRIIVKVGSALLTANGKRVDAAYVRRLAAQIAAVKTAERQVVVVSSGAIAAGMSRLGWKTRPTLRADLQVAAAVGQMRLMNIYEASFSRHGAHAAQILLSAEDMAHRTLYLNARTTLKQIIAHGVIPVVNENDVIATDDVSFGDNDRLAAQIANLWEADLLLILTNAPGLCRENGEVVAQASANDDNLMNHVRSGDNRVGSGGMASKLSAAKIAARSGAHSFIVNGRAENCIARVLNDEKNLGTFLAAEKTQLSARKLWLASGLNVRGKMILDAGAARAVVRDKRSLLPAGVREVQGRFVRGDSVRLTDENKKAIGYALVNYDSKAAKRLCGVKSGEIFSILGYMHEKKWLTAIT